MLSWKEMPWHNFERGFRQGRVNGRISWNSYLLQISYTVCAGIALAAILNAARHRLTHQRAVLYADWTAVIAVLIAFLLALRLRTGLSDQKDLMWKTIICCAGAAIVLALCLPKL